MDECIDEALRHPLTGHLCKTCRYGGFKDFANGELIDAADQGGFQALITVDRNMAYQQSIENRAISTIVLPGRTTNTINFGPQILGCLLLV
ncbi:MAG: hypothetical protein M3Y24_07690 [Acidobacteriota bacterium]|nr:hypothetical protein [Acidobacteriota bacterium]